MAKHSPTIQRNRQMIKFLNSIDSDIVADIDSAVPAQVTDNNIKCSKSVVPNALYCLSQGKSAKLCIGTLGLPLKTIATHCWVESEGEKLQTRVPNLGKVQVKTFETASVELTPGDLEESKKQIKNFMNALK